MKASKENEYFCSKQIERLQGLEFWATLSDTAIKELVTALMNNAISQAQAEMMVSTWLAENLERPRPAHFHRMGKQMNHQPPPETTLPPPCDACRQFDGRIMISFTIATGSIRDGETATALAPCCCPRGRALAAGEARYKAEQEKQAEPAPKPLSDEEREKTITSIAKKKGAA
jgi:hypothetical protein